MSTLPTFTTLAEKMAYHTIHCLSPSEFTKCYQHGNEVEGELFGKAFATSCVDYAVQSIFETDNPFKHLPSTIHKFGRGISHLNDEDFAYAVYQLKTALLATIPAFIEHSSSLNSMTEPKKLSVEIIDTIIDNLVTRKSIAQEILKGDQPLPKQHFMNSADKLAYQLIILDDQSLNSFESDYRNDPLFFGKSFAIFCADYLVQYLDAKATPEKDLPQVIIRFAQAISPLNLDDFALSIAQLRNNILIYLPEFLPYKL